MSIFLISGASSVSKSRQASSEAGGCWPGDQTLSLQICPLFMPHLQGCFAWTQITEQHLPPQSAYMLSIKSWQLGEHVPLLIKSWQLGEHVPPHVADVQRLPHAGTVRQALIAASHLAFASTLA